MLGFIKRLLSPRTRCGYVLAGGYRSHNGQIVLTEPGSPTPLTDEQLDDMVDKWHHADTKLELHEYLGWTKAQYARWVETGLTPWM